MNARILLAMSIACLSALSLNAFIVENQLDEPITLQDDKARNVVTIQPNENHDIDLDKIEKTWTWDLLFEYDHEHYLINIQIPAKSGMYLHNPQFPVPVGKDKLRLLPAEYSDRYSGYVYKIAPGVGDKRYITASSIDAHKNLTHLTGAIIQKDNRTGKLRLQPITGDIEQQQHLNR